MEFLQFSLSKIRLIVNKILHRFFIVMINFYASKKTLLPLFAIKKIKFLHLNTKNKTNFNN
jgi:hypothetical protein